MNDNNKPIIIKKLMKRDFNKLGITLLAQELISYVVMFTACICIFIIQIIKNPNIGEVQFGQILEAPNFIGTMSIITVIISFIPILIYRRNKFFQYDLKVENKKFTLKTVIISLIILLSVNSILVLLANALELGLNTFGLTANAALEELEILNKSTVSMIIYTCIIAPIFEEFIYRGAVLRSLEKYGRKFAILISAILFGLMHGNFYQIFMAAGAGIILGYLATEYSIKLTIILHMCNNTFAEVISQMTSNLNGNIGNIIDVSMVILSVIIVIIAYIHKKNSVKKWLQNNVMEKRSMLRFFTSITIILIILIDLHQVLRGIKAIL